MIQEILDAIKAGETDSSLEGRVSSMITQSINQPKVVIVREPLSGVTVRENSQSREVKLELSDHEGNKFKVFIRSHVEREHNFSVGLDYISDNKTFARIPIVRYNGPHDHRPQSHIHKLTIADLQDSLKLEIEKIELRSAENTDLYYTFEELLQVFPKETNIHNFANFISIDDFITDKSQERLFQ